MQLLIPKVWCNLAKLEKKSFLEILSFAYKRILGGLNQVFDPLEL